MIDKLRQKIEISRHDRRDDIFLRMQTPQLSHYYLDWLRDYLRQSGHAPCVVLGELGNERPFLSLDEWRQMLELAAMALKDPDLGLHFGQTVTPSRFGVLGYLLHHCDTLGQAGRRMYQYMPLVFQLQRIQAVSVGNELRLVWSADDNQPSYHEEVFWLASIVQFARALTGEHLQPSSVGLVSQETPDFRALQQHLDCPILFSQDFTWMQGSVDVFKLRTMQPDAALRDLLEQYAKTMLTEQDELLREVNRCLIILIRNGEPTLDRVATELNMSGRTLNRRLAERGRRFRDVLDQARRRLAESYLRDPRLSLADVALLLGYAEQSPFTHAFKRWTGKTPRDWRRNNTPR